MDQSSIDIVNSCLMFLNKCIFFYYLSIDLFLIEIRRIQVSPMIEFWWMGTVQMWRTFIFFHRGHIQHDLLLVK